MSTVNIEMDVFTAASVRQILFEEQRFTHDPKCTPPRITSVRDVIQNIDDGIESVLESEKEIWKQNLNDPSGFEGDITQLVECHLCTVEVRSSSLLISINKIKKQWQNLSRSTSVMEGFCYRCRFDYV